MSWCCVYAFMLSKLLEAEAFGRKSVNKKLKFAKGSDIGIKKIMGVGRKSVDILDRWKVVLKF